MKTPARSHLAQMIYGNIDELRISLLSTTSIADVEEALAHARALSEGKTKVAMLERKLRQLRRSSRDP